MKHGIPLFLVAITLALSVSLPAGAIQVGGSPDQESGEGWQSAWVIIDPPRDFHKGEVLRIHVQGTAEWVRVRLLPATADSNKPTGLIGGKMKVPSGGVLEIVLKEDRPQVQQVSVHAGKLAWGELLNPSGGSVAIVSVSVDAP